MDNYVSELHDDLQKQRREARQKTEASLQNLLKSFSVPVTRPQWSEWLSENITEFRALMRTATSTRREGNVRVRARPDLPAPLRRIGPRRPLSQKFETAWAERLANRFGWHGIQTRTHGVVMIFFYTLKGRTYYIDGCSRVNAATGAPRCFLGASFSLVGCVYELHHLEALLMDTEVIDVWEFKVSKGKLQQRGQENWGR